VDALVVDGRSEAMMANWLLMMLDRKNNEHKEERDDLWRKAKHTIFGSVCSDLSMSFVEINGAKANLLGQLFGFLYVGVCSY